jgi:hypothetical protein
MGGLCQEVVYVFCEIGKRIFAVQLDEPPDPVPDKAEVGRPSAA